MNKNKESHPFTRVKKLITEDIENKLVQLEIKIKNNLKSNRNNVIDQIQENGGLENLIFTNFLKDYKKLLKYINNRIFVSVLVSFCVLSVFILLFQIILTTYLFPNPHNNSKISTQLDSTHLLNPDPKLNAFLLILESKSLPAKMINNNLFISSYYLKDYFEIFYLLYKCQVNFNHIHFKFPVDLFNNISKNDFNDFSKYFNYFIKDVNLDNNIEIVLQGTTDEIKPELIIIFKILFGNSTKIKYQTFELENIYFETSSVTLNETSINYLLLLSLFLNRVPNQRLLISGHADYIGDSELNKELSCRRAEAVENFLIQNKVSANRLKIECFSNLQNIDTLNEKNRRVSLDWLD